MTDAAELPQKPRYPFWGYDDLVLFISASIPSLFVAGMLMALLRRAAPVLQRGGATELLLTQFLAYGLWFLALYGILRVRHGRPFWPSLAWPGRRPDIILCLVAGPPLALAVAMLSSAMGTPDVDMPIKDLLTTRWNTLLVGIFAVTLGPLCEELAFRGFLMPLVSKSFGPLAGIIAAAAPFALLHGPQYGWSWRHVLLVGLAGMCFGWARHNTGSTAAATAMHATYNLTFFAGYLIQQGDQFGSW